jgi:hypothetical protein
MLYNKTNPSLLSDAYEDFARRLKWSIHHLGGQNDDDTSSYDPDYAVPSENTYRAKGTPAYIESGIVAGRQFIEKHISTCEPLKSIPAASPDRYMSDLKEYLDAHQLVITPTDKNLGAAIVERNWLIEGGHKLLSDQSNYVQVDYSEVKSASDILANAIQDLIHPDLGKGNTVLDAHSQLALFLASKLPKQREDLSWEEPVLPEFYVIPKIHKNPTGYRPIVPCHSVMQEPLAKLISKSLKPVLNSFPTIIHGSKDLARRLSEIRKLQPNRTVFICTGDIVAYYPNLPRQQAIKVARDEWLRHRRSVATVDDGWLTFLVTLGLKLAVNSPLFVKFHGNYFKQIKGIPMGQSCSPDIAQLYGAVQERDDPVVSQLIADPCTLFFGRFIDDVLFICYADDDAHALRMCSKITYPGLDMDWSVTEWSAPFLDMRIFVDRASCTIEHMPYRKPLNHHERIPWVSSHPKDVKRGTFLGEMSRLATLSSRLETYEEALCHLKTLYIARGYPSLLLNSWLRENKEKRWTSRLADQERRVGNVFVLKSQFNPILDSFNVHELFDVIRKEWTESCEKQPWCDLEGFCAIHNKARIAKPAKILATEKRREDTLYKHRFVMTDTPQGVPHKRAARPDSELRQTDLLEFVNQGHLGALKRLRTDGDPTHMGVPTVLRVDAGAGMRIEPAVPAGPLTIEVEGDALEQDPPDTSVSCSSSDLLPRLPAPGHPLASHCFVWERINGRTHLVRKETLDLRKTDFFTRRVMVSRKRTRNLADLFNTWKHSIDNLPEEKAVDLTLMDVDDFY